MNPEVIDIYADSEIWKPIKSFEGYYDISNHGRVRSLDRLTKYKLIFERKYFGGIKPLQIYSGYYYIKLNKNGIYKNPKIHRLVAEMFIPNPQNKKMVNHLDGNKLNNHFSNLEWCTAKENVNHSIHVLGNHHGRLGSQNGRAKITEAEVIEIRRLSGVSKYYTCVLLSKMFGVNSRSVSNILLNKSWKHILLH